MVKIVQDKLLEFLKTQSLKWYTSKEIHILFCKDNEISKVSICRGLERLTKWGSIERERDYNEKHGYKYKLTELEGKINESTN